MLRIGFANKYYTLWDVDSQPNYTQNDRGQITLTHTRVIYTYLQNLSINEDEAIAKAKSKGCTDLDVDKELYGRNSSWEFVAKGYCELPKKISPFFEFGKYDTKKIEDSNDLEYLQWYYIKTENRYAKQVLLQNGYKEFDDRIVEQEQYEIQCKEREDKLATEIELQAIKDVGYGHIIFTPERNLSSNGTTEYKNNICLRFLDYKVMDYGGFRYSLPMIDGLAKKIKGKELVLLVKVVELEYEQRELQVVYVKSIDGKQIKSHDITGTIINK